MAKEWNGLPDRMYGATIPTPNKANQAMTDEQTDAQWSSLDLSDIDAPLSVVGQAEVRRRFARKILAAQPSQAQAVEAKSMRCPRGGGSCSVESCIEEDACTMHRVTPPASTVASNEREGLTDGSVDAFLAEVRAELIRARAKFPGDRIMTIALAEEFGELCKAVLDECSANVRKEAVQTAVMCARVVLDGDGSVNEWRAERGLDPLLAARTGEGESNPTDMILFCKR